MKDCHLTFHGNQLRFRDSEAHLNRATIKLLFWDNEYGYYFFHIFLSEDVCCMFALVLLLWVHIQIYEYPQDGQS